MNHTDGAVDRANPRRLYRSICLFVCLFARDKVKAAVECENESEDFHLVVSFREDNSYDNNSIVLAISLFCRATATLTVPEAIFLAASQLNESPVFGRFTKECKEEQQNSLSMSSAAAI